jgi:hypothetical protein
VGDMDGRAGFVHAGGEGVADGVPPRERRQQRRMGVQDAAGECVVHGAVQDRPESGHHHHVDTEESLHERIKAVERTLYPATIRTFIDDLATQPVGGGPSPETHAPEEIIE